jgi:hypothetical protein
VPRKTKKPPQPTKAKKRKTTPSGDAAWPASALGRRQVLKGVVAGSSVVASAMSLPKEWTKPVVQSIVASAQAQVSPPQGLPVPVPVNPIPVPVFAPVPIPVPVTPMAPVAPTMPVNPIFVPVPIPVPVPVPI